MLKGYIHAGWTWCKGHVYIWVMLFLYQLLWGFFLYRFLESLIVPLLHRYPNPAPTELSSQLFWMESQFQLTKTNHYMPYLWAIVGFIGIRMLLTPLIQAGTFYSMAHHRNDSGLTFFSGIRAAWKRMSLIYILETLVLLAPAYWVIPYLAGEFANSSGWKALAVGALPITLGWIIGGWIVHHLFLFWQFGISSETSFLQSLKLGCLRALPVLGISLVFTCISLVSSIMVTAAAMFWTGMTALILQQAYPALRALLKLWSLSSRYHAWENSPEHNR